MSFTIVTAPAAVVLGLITCESWETTWGPDESTKASLSESGSAMLANQGMLDTGAGEPEVKEFDDMAGGSGMKQIRAGKTDQAEWNEAVFTCNAPEQDTSAT